MSNNSDMIKMLRLVEGQQFAGLPEQRPGDQVRGTERAKKNGGQHPFHNRLVGEEISLEDKLAKKYQDMKDLHGKDKDVAEGSGPKEKAHSKYVNRNSPESQSKIQAARDRAAKDAAAEPGKKLDDRIKQKNVAEGNMPQSVIKSKQRYAAMSDKDFHTAHKDKSAEELQAMAWRHGYGKGSTHYVDKHKKGQQGVAEGSQRVDSLVTDALRVMKGAEVSDAVLALKTVLGDREYNDRPGFYKFYIKQMLDMYGQQGIAESNMPQSVIKSKQKYAAMTAQEFHAAHKNKSAEELQAMAWRHGYGKGSNHYVDKHKKGSTVTEGQEEIEYICSGCSGSGEGPHEGTTCRTCHGSGVEMGYADEPEHEHDEEELDELSINTLNRVHGAAVRDADNYTRDGDEVRAQKRNDLAGRASNQAELKKRAAGLPPSGQHELEEDQHRSPMERPMLHRIMMRHMDLIEKYGLDRVLDAVRDVADGIHIGPDDEIGTSDVSAAMVNVMNELKSQTLDEYGSLPGTSAEPVAGTTAPSSGSSTPSSTPADEPASGGSPNNTTLSSPAAAGVSAGGSSPTTPSAGGAAKPGAPAAPQPNVPDVPITPDEKSALDRIRANAGLKTQFDNLLKQVQPKVQ